VASENSHELARQLQALQVELMALPQHQRLERVQAWFSGLTDPQRTVATTLWAIQTELQHRGDVIFDQRVQAIVSGGSSMSNVALGLPGGSAMNQKRPSVKVKAHDKSEIAGVALEGVDAELSATKGSRIGNLVAAKKVSWRLVVLVVAVVASLCFAWAYTKQ
jgi:hypothetical protein